MFCCWPDTWRVQVRQNLPYTILVSDKSNRPVKSIGAAEIVAAGEAIDEGKVLVKAYEALLKIPINLFIVVDSKYVYKTLSTCGNSIDRSIRGDVSVIRYEFETKNVNRVIWVPKVSLADLGAKPNSPVTQTLQIMLLPAELLLEFTDPEYSNSEQFPG